MSSTKVKRILDNKLNPLKKRVREIERKLGIAGTEPDLPLHVRVAKLLGKGVYKDFLRDWLIFGDNDIPKNLVPDYPNDLVAAMGVLEEYCRLQKSRKYEIHGGGYGLGKKHSILIWDVAKTNHFTIICNDEPLPQAICKAIVEHAEGK